MVRLFQLAKRLRDPGGCPWDAEQTHHSLTRYLLEESYEVVEAVEALPIDAPAGGSTVPAEVYAALADELGDLLYQVVFHAVLAQEADAFTMADVARGIHDKLVRRHPHVFGDVVADEIVDVMRNWEQIKKDGEGHDVDRRGHHAGPAVAALHAQAVPQGGVGRARARFARRGARPRRRRGRADCARPTRPRGRPRAAARRRGRRRARRWRRRRIGAARLGRPLPRRFEAMERLAATRATSTSPPSTQPAVAALWLEAATPLSEHPSVAVSCARRTLRCSAMQRGQARSTAGMVPMRPALKSSIAWRISSRVFITNGP